MLLSYCDRPKNTFSTQENENQISVNLHTSVFWTLSCFPSTVNSMFKLLHACESSSFRPVNSTSIPYSAEFSFGAIIIDSTRYIFVFLTIAAWSSQTNEPTRRVDQDKLIFVFLDTLLASYIKFQSWHRQILAAMTRWYAESRKAFYSTSETITWHTPNCVNVSTIIIHYHIAYVTPKVEVLSHKIFRTDNLQRSGCNCCWQRSNIQLHCRQPVISRHSTTTRASTDVHKTFNRKNRH